MGWFRKACCCCHNRDLLYQILLELVKIEMVLKEVSQPQAVELQLKAGTPDPLHGFVNVGGK